MADVDFDDFEGGFGMAEPAGRSQRWINIAGAVTSLALIGGLGIWGYRIAVRDVMGIPVVRALAGPMRIAPEVPGGEVTANQGLAVNEVAAAGTAAAPADRLVLAPKPVDLAPDDAPGLATTAPVMTEVGAAAALVPVSAEAAAPVANANVLALADALTSAAPPADPAATANPADPALLVPDPATAGPAAAAAALPPPVAGGVAHSPRPLARPATLAAADPATASPVAVTEIDAASLTVGTRLVQLGAYDDIPAADAAWGKLAVQFGDLLAGKARVVQAAQSGGRTFYRLRAHGFETEADARRFCSALLAENAACIPVLVR